MKFIAEKKSCRTAYRPEGLSLRPPLSTLDALLTTLILHTT